jgi:hypothetical protein
VRRHAKASTAGPTQRQAKGLGRSAHLLLGALSLFVVFLTAAPALAATITDRPLLFSFNGSDTTAGRLDRVRAMAVDQASGSVYASDEEKDVVDKFNANGQATNFSATGTSSLNGSGTPQGTLDLGEINSIAVDSSGVNPGRIYVGSWTGTFNGFERSGGRVNAFSPTGQYLWQLAPKTVEPCGLAVDAEGHLWVAEATKNEVLEFANTGSPPAQIGSVTVNSGSLIPALSCQIAFDASGNLFVNGQSNSVDKYVGGAFASTLDSASSQGVTVDQSNPSGHIFTLHSETFNEYQSTGTLAGTFGANAVFEGTGVGYNPGLDHVYVAGFGGTVEAFGALTTGTVPDPAIEAPVAGVSKATLQGKVNPQSVPNSFHFEWKQGTGASWEGAAASPPQALPEDSLEHAVSFTATGLAGNTTYQVRLVTENSVNHLHSWSAAQTFETSQAAVSPGVTIDEPSAVGIRSVTVSGAVNPEEDFSTTWRLQTSTDPTCASGFTDQLLHRLESEAGTPLTVSEELTGLLPDQHYCVRISATDSLDTSESEIKEFTTAAVIPSQVFTAFAAPRTDTSARINGRVNPEGSPITYRFEYSKDGGATWTELEGEDTSGAREQIVIGEELDGLSPSTTYSYRFSVENEVGEPIQQGGVKSFSTRSSTEMSPPARGIELVNSPDKGNQAANAHSIPARETTVLSPDGEKVLWSVSGGAPEGNVGTGATYLARRTPSGWTSTSLVPPAAQQIGGGELQYKLLATTPDFSRLLFRAAGSTVLNHAENPTALRLDDSQHQEVLTSFEGEFEMDTAEMTDDGAHILVLTPNLELTDIGSGTPETVSIMPDGTPAQCLQGESLSNRQWQPDYHTMASTDASRVYFNAQPDGSGCSGLFGLYERNRESGQTTLIDPGVVGKSPELIRATPDGRSAYFLTASRLDPADANSHLDVYRWDEASRESSCLTCVVPDANVEVTSSLSNFYSSVLVSDDFSHVYFESGEQLIAGLGEQGDRNLYSLSDGRLDFVADIGDEETLKVYPRLSENGNALLFKASASRALSADRVATSCIDVLGGESGPCEELYRYDDRDGSLECVSCRPEGTTNQSEGSRFGLPQLDYRLSGDGGTIAFLTPEPLVRADVNHDLDIYEWRDGALRLITDGVSDEASLSSPSRPEVIAADRSGDNVLFGLVPPEGGLTGFEHDGQLNLYDARIGGGFEPPSPVVHCVEDSCQGPLRAAPGTASSSSSSFAGHGNLASKAKQGRCARKRGKARRRCVAESKRHKKKRGRHSHKARAHKNTRRAK